MEACNILAAAKNNNELLNTHRYSSANKMKIKTMWIETNCCGFSHFVCVYIGIYRPLGQRYGFCVQHHGLRSGVVIQEFRASEWRNEHAASKCGTSVDICAWSQVKQNQQQQKTPQKWTGICSAVRYTTYYMNVATHLNGCFKLSCKTEILLLICFWCCCCCLFSVIRYNSSFYFMIWNKLFSW